MLSGTPDIEDLPLRRGPRPLALRKSGEVDCHLSTPLAHFPGLLLLRDFPGSTTLRRMSISKATVSWTNTWVWLPVKWVLIRLPLVTCYMSSVSHSIPLGLLRKGTPDFPWQVIDSKCLEE